MIRAKTDSLTCDSCGELLRDSDLLRFRRLDIIKGYRCHSCGHEHKY